MRPKKTILLYCRDEVRCSLTRFLLHTSGGYAVLTGGSEHVITDLALFIDDARLETEDLACNVHPEVPILVLLRADRKGVNYPTRAILVPHPVANIELLDRVKMILARKRGPKSRAYMCQPQEVVAVQI